MSLSNSHVAPGIFIFTSICTEYIFWVSRQNVTDQYNNPFLFHRYHVYRPQLFCMVTANQHNMCTVLAVGAAMSKSTAKQHAKENPHISRKLDLLCQCVKHHTLWSHRHLVHPARIRRKKQTGGKYEK